MTESEHAVHEESPEFQRMREYDKVWTGPRFIGVLLVTLVIANAVIYGLASMGAG